jgi:lipopolysaccharide export LptBFGC system permease protein LptF
LVFQVPVTVCDPVICFGSVRSDSSTCDNVYIERVKGDDELGGVSIYAFNDQRRLESVRHASSAYPA